MSCATGRATLDDVALIAPLFDAYRQFYGQPADLPRARQFIGARLGAGESVIFIARKGDGAVVGFTQLYPVFSSVGTSRVWIVNDLFVAVGERGRGIGRALLAAVQAFGRVSGASRISLATAIENPARKLYQDCGFREDTQFVHYHFALD